MSFFVYALRLSDEDEYRYVGLTSTTPEDRLYKHMKDSARSKKPGVQSWINKHGSSVRVDTLEVCDSQEQVNAAEMKWIATLRDSGHMLLNQTNGGEGSSGYQRSAASNEKTRAALKNHPVSDETRQLLREAAQRRNVTDEARARIVASLPRGEDHWTYGKPRDAETREKISKALKEFNKTNPRPKHVKSQMSKEAQLQKFYAARELGLHTRWHVNRGIINDTCFHCQEVSRNAR